MPIYWVFLLAAVLFLVDALGNLGIFKNRKSWHSSTGRNATYGPIERGFRLVIGGGGTAAMLFAGAMLFSRGGCDALNHPDAYSSSRQPPAPFAAAASAAAAPQTLEEPAAADQPGPPVEPDENETRFWIYADDAGVTHMVDAERKIPAEFRDRARPMD